MQDQVLGSLCAAVSGSGMMAHLAELARWVKLSGTQEELESLRYVRSRLDDYGYRTTLLSHDAYISLPGRARVEVGGRGLACITHSFSQSSAPGGTSAPLVYVGSGGADDMAARNVAGHIVLVDGIASPAVSLRATQLGAVGQLHASTHEYLHEMCISPVWGSPTQETAQNLPRTVVCTISQADGADLKSRLANGEALQAVLHAEVDTGWRKTPILVAEMAGPGPAATEPFVLFSGHHDTWYYGVMDNGGANATMLEVARLCATQRGAWQRGLRIVFWSGHSHGRYSGSTWYADNYWDDLARRCVAHVNVDSTGARGNTVLGDVPVAAELRGLGRDAVMAEGGQELTGQRMSRAGDQSFWGVGLPAMFMSLGQQPAGTGTDVAASIIGRGGKRLGAGLGWWWHTPHDTLDKMDSDILVRDTRVYVHTLWRLLSEPVLPLDYEEHAVYLLAALDELGRGLDGRFDLAPLASRAEALRGKAGELRKRAAQAHGNEAIGRINRTLMAVSRALVPVDYTTGDRFGHDPALGQDVYPALQPLRRLGSLAAESDQAKFLTVAMIRARNRIAFALDQAIGAIEDCLAHPA
jgi:hypothetical protein